MPIHFNHFFPQNSKINVYFKEYFENKAKSFFIGNSALMRLEKGRSTLYIFKYRKLLRYNKKNYKGKGKFHKVMIIIYFVHLKISTNSHYE